MARHLSQKKTLPGRRALYAFKTGKNTRSQGGARVGVFLGAASHYSRTNHALDLDHLFFFVTRSSSIFGLEFFCIYGWYAARVGIDNFFIPMDPQSGRECHCLFRYGVFHPIPSTVLRSWAGWYKVCSIISVEVPTHFFLKFSMAFTRIIAGKNDMLMFWFIKSVE